LGDPPISVDAFVDTGAQWTVLPPELADALGEAVQRDEYLPPERGYATRHGKLGGWLGRVIVTFPAEEGDAVEIDSTCFLPDAWPGIVFLGWEGCMEVVSFGLNSAEKGFYFSAP
jgi:hypothetical protein